MEYYTTRTNERYKVLKRTHPTVWSKKTNKLIDYSKYSNEGYIILKNFITKDEISRAKKIADDIYSGKIQAYKNMEFNGFDVRSALDIHDMDGINNLINRQIIDISEQILNDKVYIHQSRINYKKKTNSNGWNWHSDFETWHSKDGMPLMRCFTLMIALDDNKIENGCLKVIPKSHNYFISCPKISSTNPEEEFTEQTEGVPSDEIIDTLINKYGVENIICNSGDAILFDSNLLHGSSTNQSNESRTNLYFVFNSITNKLVQPFDGSKPRPREMANRNPKLI